MSAPLLIKPPPAIKAVLEKTASFVAKNGRAFETRILNSDKGKTAKFAFLHGTSPFHAYYEDRVRFYGEGGVEDDAEGDKKGEKKDDNDKKDGEKENAADDKDDANKSDSAADADSTNDKSSTATAAVQHRAAKTKASIPDPVARSLLTQRTTIAATAKSRREAVDALERAKRDAGNNANSKEEVDIDQMEREVPTIAPPPSLTYTTLTAPSNLTAGQIEIIKLTAQYAALSSLSSLPNSSTNGGGGKSNFLKILTEKEWNNETVFGFLQPRNATFAYFTALVDIYKLLLGQAADVADGDKKGANIRNKGKKDNVSAGNELLTELTSATANNNDPIAAKSKALSLAAYRAEYDRHIEEKRLQQSNGADGGIGGIGGGGITVRIDWHDFVVVETIDFGMEEVVDTVAPRPRALFEGDDADKKKKKAAEAGDDAGGDAGDQKPAAMEVEAEENAEVRFARAQEALVATATDADVDDDDEPIQIDATYQAKVVSTTDSKQTTAATHVVDPISGKSVPVEHLSEHMRIQLLDPNWSKQRKTFLDKQRESNIVGGDAMAANISGFAREKGELFGSSEQELLDREASKQRLAEANKLIREQAQQQQQAAAVGASMPPPPPVQPAAAAAVPNHPRPSGLEAAPAAKRARVDAPSVPLGGAAGHPQPPPLAQPAVAPPVAPVPAAPVVPPPPPPPPAQPMAPVAPPAPTGPIDTILAPEAFIASLSDPTNVEVTVQTPADSTNASWNLDGRAVSVRVDVTTGTVKAVKEACRSELGGMPTNKMQLRMPGAGFLKDKDTLAGLNIGPGTTLDLVPKKRGGR